MQQTPGLCTERRKEEEEKEAEGVNQSPLTFPCQINTVQAKIQEGLQVRPLALEMDFPIEAVSTVSKSVLSSLLPGNAGKSITLSPALPTHIISSTVSVGK